MLPTEIQVMMGRICSKKGLHTELYSDLSEYRDKRRDGNTKDIKYRKQKLIGVKRGLTNF
jgi:hypothetical protein